MALVPRIRLGNYGNGVFGLKTSLPGYDVTVLADDNDVTKRSFNSEWPGLAKLKILGVAESSWTQYQAQGRNQYSSGSTTYSYNFSQSGWEQATPILVPTGLSFIPIWEERIFDKDNKLFYDDYVYTTSNANQIGSASGGRSYHSGPADPANNIFLLPYRNSLSATQVYNQNNSAIWRTFADPPQPYPSYPAYPAQPTNKPAMAYLIYGNKIGDVT